MSTLKLFKAQTKFLLVIVTLLFSLSASALSCKQILSGLGRERVEALTTANKGDYKVSVLTGQIDGHDKTVVFLGERHVKSAIAAQDGKNAIQLFPFRALEGANFDKLWGRKLLSWSVGLQYKLSNLFSLGRRTERSTIDEARRRELLEQAVIQIKQSIAEGKLKEEDLEHLKINIGEEEFTTTSLFKELGIDNIKAESSITNVELEEGHEPGLAEKISSVLSPAIILSCAGMMCSAGLEYAVPGNPVSTVLAPVTYSILFFNAFQFYGAKIFGRWRNSKVYRLVFSIERGFLDGRNQTMVRNIVKALKENNSDEPLLVIVGMRHNDGMEHLLQTQHGFEKHELE